MGLPPEARMGLRSSRRLGRIMALVQRSSLDVDPVRGLSLLLQAPKRILALPERIEGQKTRLLRMEAVRFRQYPLNWFCRKRQKVYY